jgi:hypothetical protein
LAASPSRLRRAPDLPAAASPGTPPAPVRRSYPLVGAGLLAALLGALLFATMTAGSDHRRSVLVVRRPVAAGVIVSADDLATLKLTPVKGVAFLPASDHAKVVGRPAAVPLVPGSLLIGAELGSPAGLRDGEAAVGLLLEPGRFPPGLRAGDHVAVVSAPTGPVPATADSIRLGTGIVEDISPEPANAGVLSRVRLDGTVSDRIAAEGAARRVALVALPGSAK